MPVWVPNLPHYKAIVEGMKGTLAALQVTFYNADDAMTPDEEFLYWLPTVDLHHGEFSEAEWNVLEVYGVFGTPEIEEALEEYGVIGMDATDFGFRASRDTALSES